MSNARLRDERLQVMLTPEELALLDDFRFENRMPSRAAAIRVLLQRGLKCVTDDNGVSPHTKSGDFGVAPGSANGVFKEG